MNEHVDSQALRTTVNALLEESTRARRPPPRGAVEDALQRLRALFELDVVFVAEFTEGQRVFRFVERVAGATPVHPGMGGALELSLCQRVVDGRLPGFVHDVSALGPDVDLPPLPIRIGTHLSTPVVMDDGQVFGTLCGFTAVPNPSLHAEDLDTLRECARLVARKLEHARADGLVEPPARWAADPMAIYDSPVWNLRGAWALGDEGRRAWLDS